MRRTPFNPFLLVLVGLVRAYRWGISPFLMPSCRFAPSCSEYALDSLLRFGVLRGGYLAVRRILRCHPWGGAGYDPVPDGDCQSSTAINSSRQA